MLNVVETSTKTFSLHRFCLSALGGILSGGILSYSKSSYFRGDSVRGGFCPGDYVRGGYVQDSSEYTKIHHFEIKNKKNSAEGHGSLPRPLPTPPPHTSLSSAPLAPQFDLQEKSDKSSTVPARQIPGYAIVFVRLYRTALSRIQFSLPVTDIFGTPEFLANALNGGGVGQVDNNGIDVDDLE